MIKCIVWGVESPPNFNNENRNQNKINIRRRIIFNKDMDTQEIKTKKKEEITVKVKQALSKLNLNEREFCRLYTTVPEFFGNGVRSYMKAYNVKIGTTKGRMTYNSCRALSSKLLTNFNILNTCDELLQLGGLNDIHVDKQLNFLITQNSDFSAKLGGIKEYNQLKGRIIKKLEHSGGIMLGDLMSAFKPEPREAEVVKEEQPVEVVETKPLEVDTGGDNIDNILKKHGI